MASKVILNAFTKCLETQVKKNVKMMSSSKIDFSTLWYTSSYDAVQELVTKLGGKVEKYSAQLYEITLGEKSHSCSLFREKELVKVYVMEGDELIEETVTFKMLEEQLAKNCFPQAEPPSSFAEIDAQIARAKIANRSSDQERTLANLLQQREVLKKKLNEGSNSS